LGYVSSNTLLQAIEISAGALLEEAMSDHKIAGEKFSELLELMAQLRGENGCPWDREQTHQTLKAFLLEETHELLDALTGNDPDNIAEELSDLLHQIVFHCQIGAENGAFTAAQVISNLTVKIIRRHPHVFGGAALPDVDAVTKQWAQIKAQEKLPGTADSALGSLPKSMPALARAQAISERAARVGFDWPDIEPVWQKVEEELSELKTACATGDRQRTGEELGDVFFSLVNLARFLGLQAEEVASQTTDKFIERFNYVEDQLRQAGKSPNQSSLEEMDRLWDKAKALERRGQLRP
jgi:tetrapyrrole methylase family protein/MazG family protein